MILRERSRGEIKDYLSFGFYRWMFVVGLENLFGLGGKGGGVVKEEFV